MTAVYGQNWITVDFSTSSLLSDVFTVPAGQFISSIQVSSLWGSSIDRFISIIASVDGSTFSVIRYNSYSTVYGTFTDSGMDIATSDGSTGVNQTAARFVPTNFSSTTTGIPAYPSVPGQIRTMQLGSGSGGGDVFPLVAQTVGIGLSNYSADVVIK